MKNFLVLYTTTIELLLFFSKPEGHIDFFYNDVTDLTWRGHRDRMVVEFSTTCAISAYRH